MASTRAQQAQILKNSTVLDQLTGCLVAAASNILNEATSTANHENRLKYANAIIASPQLQASFMLPGILTNATLAAEAGNAATASGTPFVDSDVDFFVASVFDTYATQFATQTNLGAALQFGQQ